MIGIVAHPPTPLLRRGQEEPTPSGGEAVTRPCVTDGGMTAFGLRMSGTINKKAFLRKAFFAVSIAELLFQSPNVALLSV